MLNQPVILACISGLLMFAHLINTEPAYYGFYVQNLTSPSEAGEVTLLFPDVNLTAGWVLGFRVSVAQIYCQFRIQLWSDVSSLDYSLSYEHPATFYTDPTIDEIALDFSEYFNISSDLILGFTSLSGWACIAYESVLDPADQTATLKHSYTFEPTVGNSYTFQSHHQDRQYGLQVLIESGSRPQQPSLVYKGYNTSGSQSMGADETDRSVIMQGTPLEDGRIIAYYTYLGKSNCSISFQVWRIVDLATNQWQLLFGSPVYDITQDGYYTANMDDFALEVTSQDRMGFLDRSPFPCITFLYDPSQATDTSWYNFLGLDSPTVGNNYSFVSYQRVYAFNVMASIDKIDDCSSHACQLNSTCLDLWEGYKCKCLPGYTGTFCELEINECDSSPCLNGGNCTDAMNAYHCDCASGYNGSRCEIDIDECASSPCLFGATCNDQVDGYTCDCVLGYTGLHCETDINECASSPCQNGATCSDEVGAYVCICIAGYNGSDCEIDIDECASFPCLHGNCTDLLDGYVCDCFRGYNGTNCEININECQSNPCQNGGSCVDEIDSYRCVCASGYTGENCETEVDECESLPCVHSGNCTDLVDGFVCTCLQGYAGDWCQIDVDECASSPCWNGATCVDQLNGYTCNCSSGYIGDLCQTDFDECSSSLCQHNATCNDVVNGYTCTCKDGYSGTICEHEIDECDSSPCQNGGNCTDLLNGYLCSCIPGYSGANCQTDIDECSSSPCQNDGTCIDEINQYLCNCSSGYQGVNCETDVDECASLPCTDGSTCVNLVNGYYCQCEAGFIYNGSCILDTIECTSDPCQNGGTCQDQVSAYSCECVAGYNGEQCQHEIDECSSSPCQNGGNCTDYLNGYFCTCSIGFNGTHCEIDIDDCIDSLCQNNATCVDKVNKFTCNCTAGFEGFFCEIDIDECLSFPCQNGGTCTDQIDGYICTCMPGYDGTECQIDVNECDSSPCQNGGSCQDLINLYFCDCPENFNGTRCEIDMLLNTASWFGFDVQNVSSSAEQGEVTIVLQEVELREGWVQGFRITVAQSYCLFRVQLWQENGGLNFTLKNGWEHIYLEPGIYQIDLRYSEIFNITSDYRLGFTSLSSAGACVGYELVNDLSRNSTSLIYHYTFEPVVDSSYNFQQHQQTYLYGLQVLIYVGAKPDPPKLVKLGYTSSGSRVLDLGTEREKSIVVQSIPLEDGRVMAYHTSLAYANCTISFQIWRTIDDTTNLWQLVYGSPLLTIEEQGDVQVSVEGDGVMVTSQDRLGFLDRSSSPCVTYQYTPYPTQHLLTNWYDFQGISDPTIGELLTFSSFQRTYSFNMLVELDNVNECTTTVCLNNGTCKDLLDNFTCECSPGYEGVLCETEIDECASGPCQNGGNCTDMIAFYICECLPGYNGSNCEIDIDECASFPCQNKATCVDLVDSYRCDCFIGFNGTQCETDINECFDFPCEDNATCINLIGGYLCQCSVGQRYNGTHCETDPTYNTTLPYGFYVQPSLMSSETGQFSIILKDVDLPEGWVVGFQVTVAQTLCLFRIQIWREESDINFTLVFEKEKQYSTAGVQQMDLEYQEIFNITSEDKLGFTSLGEPGMCIGYQATSNREKYSLSLQYQFSTEPKIGEIHTFEPYSQTNLYGVVVLVKRGTKPEQPKLVTRGFNSTDTNTVSSSDLGRAIIMLDIALEEGTLVNFHASLARPGCNVSFQIWRPLNGSTNDWELHFETLQTSIPGDGFVMIPVEQPGVTMTSMDRIGFLDRSSEPCITFKYSLYQFEHLETAYHSFFGLPDPTLGDTVTFYRYQLAYSFNVLVDIDKFDDCLTGTCQNGGTCLDQLDAFTCVCNLGYNGSHCEIDIDECASSPCQNGAECADIVNGYICNCTDGYGGVHCEVDIDECSSGPCQNNASCSDFVDEYICTCDAGYNGTNCEIDIDECSSSPCQNNGTCIDRVNYFMCACSPGYTGESCETDIDECASVPCLNGGQCIDQVNGYLCNCSEGFTGDHCEIDIDECASSPCLNGATCVDQFDAFVCNCSDGYDGTLCQTDVDECASSPCANESSCVDKVNGFQCLCASGYIYNVSQCIIDTVECTSSPCQNDGVCVDQVNAYRCDCTAGYQGLRCETEIDECLSSPCQHNSTCVDGLAQYVCNCTEGYNGTNCEIDIDECVSSRCVNSAVCVDAVNGYTCNCQSGYTGVHCQLEIDECGSSPCQNGANCTDNINGYLCTCLDGFNGTLCEINIDECDSSPCLNGATCVDGINGYNCTCSEGHNGTHCENDLLLNTLRWYGQTITSPGSPAEQGEVSIVLHDLPLPSGWVLGFQVSVALAFCQFRIQFWRWETDYNYTLVYELEKIYLESGDYQIDFRYSDIFNISSDYRLGFTSVSGGGVCIAYENGTEEFQTLRYTYINEPAVGDTYSFQNHQQTYLYGLTAYIKSGSMPKEPDLVYIGFNGTSTVTVSDQEQQYSIILESIPLEEGRVAAFHLFVVHSYCNISFQIWRKVDLNQNTWKLLFGSPQITIPSEGYVMVPMNEYSIDVTSDDHIGFLDRSSQPCLTFEYNPFERLTTGRYNFEGLDDPKEGNIYTFEPYQTAYSFIISVDIDKVDSCIGSVCQNGATCRDGLVGYTCDCLPGFTGTYCETEINECESLPCQNSGNCTDLIDGYLCECVDGYNGTNCEIDIDECASSPCLNSGTCVDHTNSFTCFCMTGYNGTFCEEDIDDCRDISCLDGSSCVDQFNNYLCVCPLGLLYNGTNCNIDPGWNITYPYGHDVQDLSNFSTTGYLSVVMVNVYLPAGWVTGFQVSVAQPICLFKVQLWDHDTGWNYKLIYEVEQIYSETGVFQINLDYKDIFNISSELSLGFTSASLIGDCIAYQMGPTTRPPLQYEHAQVQPVVGSTYSFRSQQHYLMYGVMVLIKTGSKPDPPVVVMKGLNTASSLVLDASSLNRSILLRYLPLEDGRLSSFHVNLASSDCSMLFQIWRLANESTNAWELRSNLPTQIITNEGFVQVSVDDFQVQVDSTDYVGFVDPGPSPCLTYKYTPYQFEHSQTEILSSTSVGDISIGESYTFVPFRLAYTFNLQAEVDKVNDCIDIRCQNNATCVDLVQAFRCMCLPGFSGTFCETDIDECGSSPCQNGGSCNDNINSFVCFCDAGFTGVLCQIDIDECSSSPCVNNATCNDQVNGYTCNCSSGYTGDHCQTDINECISSPCRNGATCIDQVDAFVCACVGGYTGLYCETDIDECISSPCLNNSTCVDEVNGYRCDCESGFIYNSTDCILDTIECLSDPCDNGGTCVDQVNAYRCYCVAGYSGIQCETEVDECGSSPCQNGGTCLDQLNGYTCNCTVGYTGDKCQTDINECSSSPCQNSATCIDEINGYQCICAPGYTGTHCETDIDECTSSPCQNSATCIDEINGYQCICAPGYTGTHCETDIDECSSSPCQNSATCIDEINGYQCICVPGYTGTHCETDIDECSSSPCQNSATCVDEINGYQCICVPGYTGTHCETDIDECSSSPCQNSATCVDEINGYQCICVPGYTGTHCETDIDECSSSPCQNSATCVDEINGYQCICVPGYTGTHCETDIDECSSSPCQNNATCVYEINGYQCICVPGYTGTHCETDIDECSSSPCQNNATCVDEINGYQCSCVPGYTGTHCDTDIDECSSSPCQNIATCIDEINGYQCICVPGYTGTHCETDIDECSSSPCQNSATCVDEINGYQCICVPGYTGTHCETDIDECSSSPCQNSATCIDEINGYQCSCVPGYTGTHCETDIDECSSSPCQNSATCIDEINGYQCICVPGYTGTHCETITDECFSSPCHNNATCLDDINGYQCLCEPGFSGIHCESDINECFSSPCQCNATCLDEINGYQCICVPGYTGTHCETDIDECSSSPCQNRATCVDQINGYQCLCVAGYFGERCEIDIDECSSSPCLNWAYCKDLANSYECACVTGFFGAHCEFDLNTQGSLSSGTTGIVQTAGYFVFNLLSVQEPGQMAIILSGVSLTDGQVTGFVVTIAQSNCPLKIQVWRYLAGNMYTLVYDILKQYPDTGIHQIYLPESEYFNVSTSDKLGFTAVDSTSLCVGYRYTNDSSQSSATLSYRTFGFLPVIGTAYPFSEYQTTHLYGLLATIKSASSSSQPEVALTGVRSLGNLTLNTSDAYYAIIMEDYQLQHGHLLDFYISLARENCSIGFQIWSQTNITDSWQLRFLSPVYAVPYSGPYRISVQNYAVVTSATDRIGFEDRNQEPCVLYDRATDPSAYIQSLIYDLSSSAGFTLGHTYDFLPYKQSYLFNIAVKSSTEIPPPVPGSMGKRGIKGQIGDRGQPGPQGKAGIQGPKGVKGELGYKGPEGKPGYVGVKGQHGSGGPTGPPGQEVKGERGSPGVKGDKGVNGIQGPVGFVGVSGPPGVIGFTGSPGNKGPRGDLGSIGLGIPGIKGIQGELGIKGFKGNFGPEGVTGPQGSAGPKGGKGEKGPPGLMWNPNGVNRCEQTTLTCDHDCVDSPLGAYCRCRTGYKLQGNEQCIDIDECQSQNGGCQFTCQNTVGSYVCRCPDGYTLSLDNHRCNDINECQSNNGQCAAGQLCLNLWGGHVCVGPYTADAVLEAAGLGALPTESLLLTENMMIGLMVWLILITLIFVVNACLLLREMNIPDYLDRPVILPGPQYPRIFPQVSVHSQDGLNETDTKQSSSSYAPSGKLSRLQNRDDAFYYSQ